MDLQPEYVSCRPYRQARQRPHPAPGLSRRSAGADGGALQSAALVEQRCLRGAKVQLAAVDGLSATAINVNLPLVLPRIAEILKAAGVALGTPCAVSRGRVAAGDHLARLTECEVLCLLVGERPGLNTAASMGIYVTYMRSGASPRPCATWSPTCTRGGLQPAQGAEQAAALCLAALREKRTGVQLQGPV